MAMCRLLMCHAPAEPNSLELEKTKPKGPVDESESDLKHKP